MIPDKIPVNCVAILPNAGFASAPVYIETAPEDNTVVITNQDTRPARPAEPSLSSDIPIPTPIAKRIAMLSIRAPPAFKRIAATILLAPQPVGSIQ